VRVTGPVSWWGARSSVERFDLATRWPLYLFSGSEPLLMAMLLGGVPALNLAVGLVVLLVTLAHTAACLLLVRAGLRHRLGGDRPQRRLVGAAIGLTLAGVAVGLSGLPDDAYRLAGEGLPFALAVSAVFVGGLTVALTLVARPRDLPYVLLLPAGLAAVLQTTAPAHGESSWAISFLMLVAPLALTYRVSGWVLGVVWEIDRGRGIAARLAVAEERLRVNRDLHDVLGRNLTLISANSELAARLAPRDPVAAAQRMLEVRRVAQDSMREARDVVGGSRTADLDAELAGARSVLRSAGIDTRVIGDAANLPPEVQAAFGWAVREATTNVLRHAEPTRVRLELDTLTDDGTPHAMLRMANDGVRPDRAGASAGHGTGLSGLRQRLAGLGGTVTTTTPSPGLFQVEVRLPLGQVVPTPRAIASEPPP
jgi:two-component system sensor histidine kinase DesK